MPDPEEKEKRTGEPWRLGDTYNVSIGQGDFMLTPLQLINYIAAIANNGKMYKPFLVKKITASNGETIKEVQPELIRDNSFLAPYIEEVRQGIKDVVGKSYGTAYALNDLPISVAGKTGTSQIQNKTKINAFFAGYLPAEALAKAGAPLDKQIAILVLIENAEEDSSSAVPVVKEVLRWYYYNRIMNKE